MDSLYDSLIHCMIYLLIGVFLLSFELVVCFCPIFSFYCLLFPLSLRFFLFICHEFPSFTLGGFAFVVTSMIIPVMIHYLLFKDSMSFKGYFMHGLIFLSSVLIMVVSSYYSLIELGSKLSS